MNVTGAVDAQAKHATPSAMASGIHRKAGRWRGTRARRRTARTIAVATAQLLAVVLLLAPIIWMYLAAFGPNLDILNGGLLPKQWTLANFRSLLQLPGLGQAFLNSTIVATLSSLAVAIVAVLAAYGLTRFRFRGRVATVGVVLVAQLVPGLVILVPLVVAMRYLHLSDSLVGLAMVHLTGALPVGVLLFRNYLRDIPVSLDEAAMVDGCSRLGAVWHVILPLLRPGIAAVTAFSFILSWGEYLMALSLISSSNNFTLPLEMQQLFELHTTNVGEVMAFGVLISLPVAIAFMLIQRSLVSNLGAGGVKE